VTAKWGACGGGGVAAGAGWVVMGGRRGGEAGSWRKDREGCKECGRTGEECEEPINSDIGVLLETSAG